MLEEDEGPVGETDSDTEYPVDATSVGLEAAVGLTDSETTFPVEAAEVELVESVGSS